MTDFGKFLRRPTQQEIEERDKQEKESNRRKEEIDKAIAEIERIRKNVIIGKRIIELLGADILINLNSSLTVGELGSDFKFAILNCSDSKSIIEKIRKDITKEEKTKKTNDLTLQEKSDFEIKVFHRLLELVKDLKAKSAYLYTLLDLLPNPQAKESFPIYPISKDKDIHQNREFEECSFMKSLEQELLKEAESIYNHRLVVDKDETATAKTFLSMKRIKKFILKLPDDHSRLAYLTDMKAAYIEGDDRAMIFLNENYKVSFQSTGNRPLKLHLRPHKFILELQEQIDRYTNLRLLLGTNIPTYPPVNEFDDEELIPVGNQIQIYFVLRLLVCIGSTSKTNRNGVMAFISRYGKDFFNQIESPSKRPKYGSRTKFQNDFNVAMIQFQKLGINSKRMHGEIQDMMKEFGLKPPPNFPQKS